nr:hypothetical protein [Suaeda aralocaspica]
MSTGNGVLSGFAEFSTQTEMGGPNLGNGTQFGTPQMLHFGGGSSSGGVGDDGEGFVVGGSALASRFRGFDQGLGSNSEFGSRNSKMLKPLDTPAPGAQPTLFQKRAALRKNDGGTNSNSNVSGDMVNMSRGEGQNGKRNSGGDNEKKRKFGNVGVVLDTVSLDGSFNYDSDDFAENSNFKLSGGGGSSSGGGGDDGGKIGGGTNSNNTSTVTGGGVGDSKGKKKGMPAKNLMAERRRRKKLNDRLYMLRSVVPKISKMDRASILGDAIDYLKELLQKINDIHNELESTPPAMAHTSNFHPLTPTLPNLPPRIKEELCSSSMPSPNGQPARVEVRLREGRAVNIHMFCGRKPGLLLSTMRALDGLGLDIQQAVISCFNGFALDIFRAEQCKEGQDLHPDQVKAMLLELATFHGSALLGNGNM